MSLSFFECFCCCRPVLLPVLSRGLCLQAGDGVGHKDESRRRLIIFKQSPSGYGFQIWFLQRLFYHGWNLRLINQMIKFSVRRHEGVSEGIGVVGNETTGIKFLDSLNLSRKLKDSLAAV